MDPNVKPGSNWPNLSPPQKLEILRRYRALEEKRKETFLDAQDNFLDAIIEEDLVEEYVHEMDVNNLV